MVVRVGNKDGELLVGPQRHGDACWTVEPTLRATEVLEKLNLRLHWAHIMGPCQWDPGPNTYKHIKYTV